MILEILLDGISILDKVVSMRLERRREEAVDTLTLELADYSLYSEFDFGTVPSVERIEVLTGALTANISQGKFFVEKPDVIENKDLVSMPSLWGRGALARLVDPFAGRLTRTYGTTTTLYELVRELVAMGGMDPDLIQIDIDDFVIPAGVYSVANQFPLQIIIDLAAKTNGVVRSQKNGALWIQKDLFHFDAVTAAESFGDDEIIEARESLEYPQFGNRILVHSSVSSGGMNARIRLSLETRCIRSDGSSSTQGEAVVTDSAGNAVADGTGVEWSIDNPFMAVWAPPSSITDSRAISGEIQRASSLGEVSTAYPIREVLGVYLENDQNRARNFYTGGAFIGSSITLAQELPFTDSRVVIDYVAAGLAVSTLIAVAGAPNGEGFVHASIGRVRDTQEFCINNNRNISLSLKASKTEYNLCAGEEGMISELTAHVKIDGVPGHGASVAWSMDGDAGGLLSAKFSTVTNQILTELATSQNNFTVATQEEIVSVLSVMLEGSGTNFYKNAAHRTPGFNGNQITLGTNLPDARMPVIIRYTASAIVRANYSGPKKIGRNTITASISNGSSEPDTASVEIVAANACTGGAGGVPSEPVGAPKKCSDSTASAANCAAQTYPNVINVNQTECICRKETGISCPTTEEDCRKMCEGLYNKYGVNPLACDKIPTEEEIKVATQASGGTTIPEGKEAAYVSCFKEAEGDPDRAAECIASHAASTIDRCTQQCFDHGLLIAPTSGSIACSGAKQLNFSASGGKPPYNWSATAGEIKPSGQFGESAELKAPANAGGAGIAYTRLRVFFNNVPPTTCGGGANCATFLCDDSRTDNSEIVACCPELTTAITGHPNCEGTYTCDGGSFVVTEAGENIVGPAIDKRSPAMIAAGCNPCGLHFAAGAVVTVTDAKGNSASAVVTA